MGMFDTFNTNYNNSTHEVQTKRFENVLDVWEVGDVINQPSFGVQVLYELAEDVDGRLEYAFEEDANVIIYIVIANGVYVENIADHFTSSTDIAEKISDLENKWQDTNRQITSFTTHLSTKQQLSKTYYRKLNLLIGYIDEFKNPSEGGMFSMRKLHFPKIENISNTEELVDVLYDEIKTTLTEESNPINVVYDDNPLARYRV